MLETLIGAGIAILASAVTQFLNHHFSSRRDAKLKRQEFRRKLLLDILEALIDASNASVEAEIITKRKDRDQYEVVKQLQRMHAELGRAESLSWCADNEGLRNKVRQFAAAMREIEEMESGDVKSRKATEVNRLFGDVTIALGSAVNKNL